MKIKVIRTQDQYDSYLSTVEELITKSAPLSQDESDNLDLLTVLISDYENNKYPIELVDPIDAIKFRMHEKGLKQIDLAPYFGTKSRVSEVLSGKRPLTVSMIRAISVGLGISVDTLIGEDKKHHSKSTKESIDWTKFPLKEMQKRGWIKESFSTETKSSMEEKVKEFMSQLGNMGNSAAFKRTLKGDSYSPATQYSLYAWLARVVQKSRNKKDKIGAFNRNVLSREFLKELTHMSWFDSGPLLAIEFLEKHGICVVVVPALKGTLVDGAALKDDDGMPIIALTLRHDRLDNFWFTLLHELVHIWKHVNTNETFIDDIEHSTKDKIEAEANRIARDIFVPRSLWKRTEAYLSPSKQTIDSLSRDLRIHPSIIAGRIRRETNDYTKLNDLVGYGEVRKHFNISNGDLNDS
jgi:HTH-type transcriptional regulator/antitoxin HigA